LPPGDHDCQRTAVPVHPGVDLRGQPTPRPSDPVTCGFTLLEGSILVIRAGPPCPAPGGSCSCRAGAPARSWRPHSPASPPHRRRQPRPTGAPAPGPTSRPRRSGGAASTPSATARTRPGHVPPRDPSAVPVDDPLDHPPVVPERVPPPARVRGQQRFDPRPLLITDVPKPRNRRHPPRIPEGGPDLWETRPR